MRFVTDVSDESEQANLTPIHSPLLTLKSLFMSGFSDDIPELIEAVRGGSQFIQKPFTRKSLAEAVRKALK